MPDPLHLPSRRLRVFVSSAMLELETERQYIKEALSDLKIDAWVYESDAGARDQSTRATYLDELKAADLYIGVFWKKYGAYTIDEYQQALKWEKARLIFVKKAADAERDEPLREFLADIGEMDTGARSDGLAAATTCASSLRLTSRTGSPALSAGLRNPCSPDRSRSRRSAINTSSAPNSWSTPKPRGCRATAARLHR